MTGLDILGWASAVLMIGAYVPYIAGTLKGTSKPVRATWILWASLDVLLAIAMYKEGKLNMQIVGACIGALSVAALSLRYGKRGWSTLDIVCLAGGMIGIVLWLVNNDPVQAIVTAVIVMFIGAVPTFASAWEKWSRENKWSWLMAFLSCLAILPTLPPFEDWNVAAVAQPLVFTTIETIMMFLVWVRPLWAEERISLLDDDH